MEPKINAHPGPDLVLHNARVLTMDGNFSIQEAVAATSGRIVAVGTSEQILGLAAPRTSRVDLDGRTVLPGLIDSHLHTRGCMTEFDHRIPTIRSIDDVLRYVHKRASQLQAGEWIRLDTLFFTRLREQRYPTREELDAAAPQHPVLITCGPKKVMNSPALELDGDYEPPSATRRPTAGDRYDRTLMLFEDYASVGLTTISDRSAESGALDLYQQMLEAGDLPLRLAAMCRVRNPGDVRSVARHPLAAGGDRLWINGVKVFLDGGMLYGTACMQEPWGVGGVYGIEDPAYRGRLFIEPQALEDLIREATDQRLQFTAHAVGDGAVHTMLEAYRRVATGQPIAHLRPAISHANFLPPQAIETMALLGIMLDIQPAWLYLDGRTLRQHFGRERMRLFQPLRSLFAAGVVAGGGSDHMEKIGSLRATNPYNPWLGMWITLTRRPRWSGRVLNEEERLSRVQALRLYTTNNARLLFREEAIGSIEAGKCADLIVIDRDILTCPLDAIPKTRVLRTYVGGQLVHRCTTSC